MTGDAAVEVMARGIALALGHRWETLSNLGREGMYAVARAAIRALYEAGGLVVAEMPASVEGAGEFLIADNDRMRHAMIAARASGYNSALAAVRAKAAEMGE